MNDHIHYVFPLLTPVRYDSDSAVHSFDVYEWKSSEDIPKRENNTQRNDNGDNRIIGVPTSSNGINECIDGWDVIGNHPHHTVGIP